MSTDEIAVAKLPRGAAMESFQMLRYGGRDQVAAAIAHGTWESFEQPFPAFFYACAKRWPGLIIDVGANTGFYTLLGVGASTANSVVAFEPDASIMSALQKNLELNHLKDRIDCSTIAMSNRSGRAILYVPTQEHGLIETSSSLEAGFKPAHSEARDIEVDTLDAFLTVRRLFSQAVSIIKIDVEGHESPVIMGSENTIAKWRPILFVEVLDRADFQFLNDFIKRHDYADILFRPEGAVLADGPVSFDAAAWNHAFIPSERVLDFKDLDLPFKS